MRDFEDSLLGQGEERALEAVFAAFAAGDAEEADRAILAGKIDVAMADAERVVSRRPKTLLSMALESPDEDLLDVLLLRSPLLKSVDADAIGGHLLAEACRIWAGWPILAKAWRLCQNAGAVGPWGPDGAAASVLGISILESRLDAARFLLERGADPEKGCLGRETGADLAARVARERPSLAATDILALVRGPLDGLRAQWEARSSKADEALALALASRDAKAARAAFGRGAVFRWGDYARQAATGSDVPAGSEAEALLALSLEARDAEIAKILFLNSKILRPELFERARRHRAGLEIYRMAVGFMETGAEEPCDETGRTALHRAALDLDAEACQALLEAGADPEARTGWKRTPADIARESGDEALLAAFGVGGARPRGDILAQVIPPESIAALVRRAADMDGDSKKAMGKIGERLKEAGGERSACPAPDPKAILALAERFPVFREAIEDIAAQASLLRRAGERDGKPKALKIPNMLLLGKPGIGKTHFLRTLSAACGAEFEQIQMSSASAGFVLSGMDPGWAQARPGKIFSLLAHGESANPIVLLDEIDKAGGSSQFPVDGPLFALLERETAREWRDEFADVPVDASLMSFIASANSLEGMHEAIVSRFQVYSIPDPDRGEALQIARSVYRGALEQAAWGPLFDPEPDEEVLDILAAMSPREAHRALAKAFGAASLRGKSRLGAEDFRGAAKPEARRIGF